MQYLLNKKFVLKGYLKRNYKKALLLLLSFSSDKHLVLWDLSFGRGQVSFMKYYSKSNK